MASRNRRALIFISGLAAVLVGVTLISAAIKWGLVPLEVGVYLAEVLLGGAIIGAVWWVMASRAVKVEETAPRTVRYIYMPPPGPTLEQRWSTVYMPRSHPLEDGLTLRMWDDLRETTGEIRRPR